ncbi:polycomb protein Sfmbt isoform X2 [Phlebotomus argentipes]|uniref:polycomb protein Sfmbt isoform X2 n=1 Tax=Phlebotomus argentipes TaxID=94469 RepID=UPI0028929ABD|nr:polycomb protein Sfmbt isoform X2 [Phlebotomus argentipes]
MDINLYNANVIGMNPADLGMVWMGHNSIIMDENATNPFFAQTSLPSSMGLSVMDDLSQQTQAMDVSPMMGVVSDFSNGQASAQLSGEQQQQPLFSLPAHVAGPIQVQVAAAPVNNCLDATAYKINPIAMSELETESLQEHFQQQQQQILMNDEHRASFRYRASMGLENGVEMVSDFDMSDFVMQQQQQQQQQENSSDEYSMGATSPKHQTIATQTSMEGRDTFRKIKPVKRPGLVLKTPIAYEGNVDPSEIPIQKDGMAVCEKCGAIGVKHSFYTKERRFCSMSCARNFGVSPDRKVGMDSSTMEDFELSLKTTSVPNTNYKFTYKPVKETSSSSGELFRDVMPQEEMPQIMPVKKEPLCAEEERIETVRRRPGDSFDWTPQLSLPGFVAASVTCFRHVPGYDVWSKVSVGMKVEVENTDCDKESQTTAAALGYVPHSFWVASLLRIQGYKGLLRYEGFDDDASHDFWVNLCSSEVHHVGWCATRGKPLIPPKTIAKKYSDWKAFLTNRLSNARTLPTTFYNKLSESFKSRFRPGQQLEVVDKNRISQVKVATIQKIVGKRLYVRYYDDVDDNGFWCHEDSSLIHPVGWATTVGHRIAGPMHYMTRMGQANDAMIELLTDDATHDLFKMNFTYEEYYLDGKVSNFKVGMKLEAIDPLNLSSICVASVMAVLKFGYMMIRIDFYDPVANGTDWFCYHEKSPCIFPVGFCARNNIQLIPPAGYTVNKFSWDEYLRSTGSSAAGEELFSMEVPHHKFQVGMKIECADLMDPRLVCVATISRVVGRLLKVHFDGWEDEYDQWLDCESPDIFPVGWCVMVKHRLEGPKVSAPVKPMVAKKRGKKKMKGGRRGMKNQTSPASLKSEKEAVGRTGGRRTDGRLGGTISIKKEQRHSEDEEDLSGGESDISEQTNQTEHSDTSSSLAGVNAVERIKPTAQSSSSTSPLSNPPSERKATSYINNSAVSSPKYIPRLNDTSSLPDIATGSSASSDMELCPEVWNIFDVATFLRVNDWTAYCDTFSRNKVDGKRLLELTKDEIITMLSMKVGPSLKIYDLIQQLKCKLNPTQLRRGKKFL